MAADALSSEAWQWVGEAKKYKQYFKLNYFIKKGSDESNNS